MSQPKAEPVVVKKIQKKGKVEEVEVPVAKTKDEILDDFLCWL